MTDPAAERDLHQTYRALTDALDEGYCVIEMIFGEAERPVDFRVLEVNPAFEVQTGLTDAVGKRMREIAPDHEEFWYETYSRIALSGVPERFEHRADVLGRWYSVYAFRVGDPAHRRLAVLFNDIGERKRAEQQLRASEERIRSFGEASPDVLWMRDAATLQWTYLTPAFETIYGIGRDEALKGDNYDNWLGLIVPEDRERAAQAIAKVREGEQVAVDYRVRRPCDGTVRWLRNTDFPIRDAHGEIVQIGGVGQDITELQESGARAALLLAELQHRVRNILAMIRSLVRRSREGHDDLDEFTAHLIDRLDAMSRTQVLLTRAAGAKLSLATLIWDELQAQIADEDRVTVSGPDVALSPRSAEVLTLALHELATNAVKYGALSSSTGQLAITWAVDRGESTPCLQLVWEERCPDVRPYLIRDGFGMELIEERVPYELNGAARLVLTDRGVRAEISFPLNDGSIIVQTGVPPAAGLRQRERW